MNFELDICEVCGSQSADHAGWFSVAGSGASLEVLPWTDELRRRDDCHHACCGDHVEKLLLSAAAHDLPGALFVTAGKRAWNPEALVPSKAETDDMDESLVSLLSAVDSILHARSDDDEEEGLAGFEA